MAMLRFGQRGFKQALSEDASPIGALLATFLAGNLYSKRVETAARERWSFY